MRPIEPHNVVRGQYSGYRGKESVADDSDTETFIALKVEIDNWRWAGVPFFLRTGKKLGRGRPDHLDRVQGAAADDVPGRVERRHPGSRPPDVRPGRPVEDVVVVLRQAPRPGMKLEKLSMQFATHDTHGVGLGPRGLRAAHPRRDARRPHAVHDRRRHRDAVGEVRRRCSTTRRRCAATRPARWGPNAIHQLIAPHAWRLPFERSWRDPNSEGQ